jgi:hypothetical protein
MHPNIIREVAELLRTDPKLKKYMLVSTAATTFEMSTYTLRKWIKNDLINFKVIKGVYVVKVDTIFKKQVKKLNKLKSSRKSFEDTMFTGRGAIFKTRQWKYEPIDPRTITHY